MCARLPESSKARAHDLFRAPTAGDIINIVCFPRHVFVASGACHSSGARTEPRGVRTDRVAEGHPQTLKPFVRKLLRNTQFEMSSSQSAEPSDVERHPWERPGYNDESSEDEAGPESEREAAAVKFLDILIDLYLSSVISAKTFATVCYYAALAGMPGDVSRYSYKPGASSGNYQKHLDKAMGFDKSKAKFYELQIPGYPRSEAGRAIMAMPMRPPARIGRG